MPTTDCVRHDVPEYPAAQEYVQFPGIAEYVQAVTGADGFPTVSVQTFGKDGFAAQEPRLAVHAAEAAPPQSPSHVQVAEAPVAGKAGVGEAVPWPQNGSAQNEASRYA
ncbi:MAG: hypothetical protein WA194_05060 [Patescibacteria group bacterium]